ncbi:hypothetical protein MMB232_03112 [Brevundimonas subvibrioides]|uniref:Uncharacterized protein n=1 Tax=Brevundimonas subvibrioides (strain ATCC 15264 / DSM 4735 / LMG 14903 / NBRC 16000 / CB 81) TaxID=633149 RepID=D9QFJ5_BRESC|nr:hypothetical protein Bresu_3204 [Brevundimonas subvibrioides ATCC 15264]
MVGALLARAPTTTASHEAGMIITHGLAEQTG